jgi:hypothetical protein
MNIISKDHNDADTQIKGEEKFDLLQLIHDDNEVAAELFFQFTQAEEDDEKQKIFAQIKAGLTIHAQLGEELLYPLVIETAEKDDKKDAKKLVAETEAGNYIASIILDELTITEIDDEYFEAKMAILCELTKKQVKREEKKMFDKLRAADIDFKDIGAAAAEMKAELEEDAQRAKTKSKSKSKTKSTSKAKGSSKQVAKKSKTTKKANSSKSPDKKTSSAKKKKSR